MVHRQRDSTKMNRPKVIVDLPQDHRLSDQGFTEVEHLAGPLDLPLGANPRRTVSELEA
jgi:hypothetical protein